jgi:CRISPR-associated endonuclease Csn1
VEWQYLSNERRNKLYFEKFLRKSKTVFPFSEIIDVLAKDGLKNAEYNFKPKTSVSGCPISARIKGIFGLEFNDPEFRIPRTDIRKLSKSQKLFYTNNDIWHILFSFEDEDHLVRFAEEKLKLKGDQIKEFTTLWKNLPNGYAALSINAINRILPFLREGLIYSEAVLLANMPRVFEDSLWTENKEYIKSCIQSLIDDNRREKQFLGIVNNLIANHKTIPYGERTGHKDDKYLLSQEDRRIILEVIEDAYGLKTWGNINDNEKARIIGCITELYQNYFRSGFEVKCFQDKKYLIVKIENRQYLMDADSRFYKLPTLLETIKQFLTERFQIPEENLNCLYHPSQIEIYTPSHPDVNDYKLYLQSPKTGAFKNPMAMRTLHELRKIINYLIKTGKIDESTHVTVEVARDLTDANQRWAIETYQRRREEENQEFARAILELRKEILEDINPPSPDDIDKFRLWYEQIPDHEEIVKQIKSFKEDIQKYRLWKEQGCQCMYTGKIIRISDLFDTNRVDFEHTIPRSLSFDNSLANLTVCYADYNRNIKKKRLPFDLENYENEAFGYSPIKPRLEDWERKVNDLQTQVEFWRSKSKAAQDKEAKDNAIRERHLREFDLLYWQNKLIRFKLTEVTSGFKNSQLVDTRIISKYAFHYLKTVFNDVDVQKGSTTAAFRKIFGIQQKDELKSRIKHCHHAIDAATLTLIPSSAKRESILKNAYELEENSNEQYHVIPYPSFNYCHIQNIENELLTNFIKKDRALTPGKKIIRKRGKIVYLRNKDGKLNLDEKGEKKPKIAKGDSIRGQLHLETFYGKVRIVKRDQMGKPLRNENNEWIYEEKNKEFSFVVRKPVTSIASLDDVVDPILRHNIEKQLNGRSLKAAFAEGIYILDKYGNPSGNKIRHIRCWANIKDPLEIKKQTYKSKHDYKNSYWAANATSFLYALYKDKYGHNDFRPLNLFQASKIMKMKTIVKKEDFFKPTIPMGKGKTLGNLYAVLCVGQKVLFYRNDKTELFNLSNSELSRRLYYIKNLFDSNDGRLQFQHHLEARPDKQLTEAFSIEKYGKRGKNGFSEFNFEFPWPRLLLSRSNFNFIIENKDFLIKPDGNIIFIRDDEKNTLFRKSSLPQQT